MSWKQFCRPAAISLALIVGVAFSAGAALKNGTESNFWQKLKNGERPSVVIVGHSTSQAWGSTFCSSSKSFVSWPAVLKSELEAVGAVDVLSCTCAGNSSLHFAGIVTEGVKETSYGNGGIECVKGHAADALIIEFAIGADCVSRFNITVNDSKNAHKQLFDEFLSANPESEIFLWTGARSYGGKWEDRSSRSSSNESQPEYAQMYVDLAAEEGFYVVDTYTELFRIHEEEGLNPYKQYMNDENHTSNFAAENIIVPSILSIMQGDALPWEAPLALTAPKSGDKFMIGENIDIEWRYNPDQLTNNVEVSFSLDAGKNWIALSGDPVDKTAGAYSWQIPQSIADVPPLTQNGMIKINEYNNEAIADTVAGIYIVPAGSEPLVIDNGSSAVEVSGSWTSSSSTAGYVGLDYLHDAGNTDKTGMKVIYKATIPEAGDYLISANWTSHENRAQEAPYEIHAAGGTQVVKVNQEQNGGQWNELGTFTLSAGDMKPVVTINAEGTPTFNEIVIADAVKLELLGPPSTSVRMAAGGAGAQRAALNHVNLSVAGASMVTAPAGAQMMTVYDLAGRVIARESFGAPISGDKLISLPRRLVRHGVVCVEFSAVR